MTRQWGLAHGLVADQGGERRAGSGNREQQRGLPVRAEQRGGVCVGNGKHQRQDGNRARQQQQNELPALVVAPRSLPDHRYLGRRNGNYAKRTAIRATTAPLRLTNH